MALENEEGADLNINQTASDDEVKLLAGQQTQTPGDGGNDDDELDLGGDDGGDDEGSTKKSLAEQEAGSDEDRAKARDAEKVKRLNQRQRQKQRIETLERQLANALAGNQDANQRLSQLENNNVSSQYAQLQKAEQETLAAETQAKDIIADATVKGDGLRAAEATQALIQLQERKSLILNAKQQMEQQSRQPKARPLDRETVNHAQAFMTKVPWYKGVNAADQDSRILSAIDNTMANEGWDPRSPTYWAELESRAKQYLGHRFKAAEGTQERAAGGNEGYNPPNQPQRPKSPVAGGGSNNFGGGENSTKYRLSAERVKAMKEAGIWEDPKRREGMIKRYQELDKQSASQS